LAHTFRCCCCSCFCGCYLCDIMSCLVAIIARYKLMPFRHTASANLYNLELQIQLWR
jgi:hypothetical protein